MFRWRERTGENSLGSSREQCAACHPLFISLDTSPSSNRSCDCRIANLANRNPSACKRKSICCHPNCPVSSMWAFPQPRVNVPHGGVPLHQYLQYAMRGFAHRPLAESDRPGDVKMERRCPTSARPLLPPWFSSSSMCVSCTLSHYIVWYNLTSPGFHRGGGVPKGQDTSLGDVAALPVRGGLCSTNPLSVIRGTVWHCLSISSTRCCSRCLRRENLV